MVPTDLGRRRPDSTDSSPGKGRGRRKKTSEYLDYGGGENIRSAVYKKIKNSPRKAFAGFYGVILPFMHNITAEKGEICDTFLVTRLTVHEYR